MKHLIPGIQDEKRLALLLSLTSIRSEGIIEGLMWHLVKGHQIETAAALAEVKPSLLSRALSNLNEVAGIVESIKEHDRVTHFIGDGETAENYVELTE